MRSLVLAATVVALVASGCGRSPSAQASLEPTSDETALAAGIRPDAAVDCAPLRDDLPDAAVAAVECGSPIELVERSRFVRFASTDALLAAYFALLAQNGVERGSGGCFDGGGENAYVPGPDDGTVPEREACFAGDGDRGQVTLVATLPSAGVLIEVDGVPADPSELDAWVWAGNRDTPGRPTLWSIDET